MEDILDVYERPYDQARPVVCIDEKNKQLLGTPNGEIPAAPGRAKRLDSEYKRNGTANVFGWIEPLTGRRNADVMEGRTAIDFAEQLRELVDVAYPDIELSILSRQCLNRRIADIDTLRREVAAYNQDRNNTPAKIDWQFTTADAKIKLRRLYPKIIRNQLN